MADPRNPHGKRTLADVFTGEEPDPFPKPPETPLMYLPGADDSDDDVGAQMARGAAMAAFMRGGPRAEKPLTLAEIRSKLGQAPADAAPPPDDYMDFDLGDAAAADAARPPGPPPPPVPLTTREREAEQRDRGLETPLDASNVGFRMLEKMGYSGGGLGKQGGGMAAPLAQEAAAPGDTRGLGSAHAARRAQALYEEQKRVVALKRSAAFAGFAAQRAADQHFYRAARRARSACRDLDEREGLPWTPLWPGEAKVGERMFTDAAGQVYSRGLDGPEVAAAEPVGLDAEQPEVQLRTAVAYLRDVHGYCLSRGERLVAVRGVAAAGSPSLDDEVRELLDDAED